MAGTPANMAARSFPTPCAGSGATARAKYHPSIALFMIKRFLPIATVVLCLAGSAAPARAQNTDTAPKVAPVENPPQPTAPPKKAPPELKWHKMDLGPFFSGTIKAENTASAKGIVIKIGTD